MVKDLFLTKMDIKYNVCTLEFDSCTYIQEKKQKKNTNVKEGHMLLFCWDTDSFRQINITAVTNVQPLGTILRNRRQW